MRDILFIYYQIDQLDNFSILDEFKRIHKVSQYDVENIDLSRYKGVLTSLYLDQYLFKKIFYKFKEFIENGGRVFHNGHIIIPFFDELKEFEPVENIKLEDFFITQLTHHQIYDGINIKDLDKRKGVAGFYSRGQNPPPLNARIITAIKDASVPTDWEIDIGKGKFYTHAGNDLYTCADEDTNKILFKNIVRYLGGYGE